MVVYLPDDMHFVCNAVVRLRSRCLWIKHNETLKGVIVGTYDLGCLFGALATIWVGERIGRKRSIILGTVIMLTGAFLQTLANDVAVMVADRIVSGLGNGMNTATAPVWAAEASKTANRGKAGITLMVINIVGLAISCWMTYVFSFVTSEFAWRFPLGFQTFFGAVILAFAYWLPESPRWLMSKHREREAMTIMAALEGIDATRTSGSVMEEFNMIKLSIASEQSRDVKRRTMPKWRLLLGVGAQGMQQLTGINIICYYLPYVLVESVGQDSATARLVAAVNALSYLGATLIGLRFIDKWGRRRLMYLGATGQCLCWLSITVLLFYADKSAVELRGSARDKAESFAQRSHKTKFLFNVFFGAGWQGVSWLYPTEINSTQNRILGMSLGVATNWAINFAVVFVTPIGIAKLKAQFYIIWTICNLLIVPTIYLFYPETSGRSLEAIDTLFENNNTIWAAFNPDMYKMKPISRVSSDEGTDTENGNAAYLTNIINPQADAFRKEDTSPFGNLSGFQREGGRIAALFKYGTATAIEQYREIFTEAIELSKPYSQARTLTVSMLVDKIGETQYKANIRPITRWQPGDKHFNIDVPDQTLRLYDEPICNKINTDDENILPPKGHCLSSEHMHRKSKKDSPPAFTIPRTRSTTSTTNRKAQPPTSTKSKSNKEVEATSSKKRKAKRNLPESEDEEELRKLLLNSLEPRKKYQPNSIYEGEKEDDEAKQLKQFLSELRRAYNSAYARLFKSLPAIARRIGTYTPDLGTPTTFIDWQNLAPSELKHFDIHDKLLDRTGKQLASSS
ncbi:MAG: hypothetical protein Q9217_004548 [Psora testacea]